MYGLWAWLCVFTEKNRLLLCLRRTPEHTDHLKVCLTFGYTMFDTKSLLSVLVPLLEKKWNSCRMTFLKEKKKKSVTFITDSYLWRTWQTYPTNSSQEPVHSPEDSVSVQVTEQQDANSCCASGCPWRAWQLGCMFNRWGGVTETRAPGAGAWWGDSSRLCYTRGG